IIRLVEKVRRLDKRREQLHDELRGAKADKKAAIQKSLDDEVLEMARTLDEMRLNKKTIDKIVQILKREIARIEEAEAPVKESLKGAGVEFGDFKSALRKCRGNRHAEQRLAKKLGLTRGELGDLDEKLAEAL